MAREQANIIFEGFLESGQIVPFAPASYDRQLYLVTPIALGQAPNGGDLLFEFSINGVAQPGGYTLPNGNSTIAPLPVNGTTGILVPANTTLAVVTRNAAGASFVSIWIESQALVSAGNVSQGKPENTFVRFNGPAFVGQAADFPVVLYDRVVQQVAITPQSVNMADQMTSVQGSTAPLVLQFLVNGVAQAGSYMLPFGSATIVLAVAGGGFTVATGQKLTAQILDPTSGTPGPYGQILAYLNVLVQIQSTADESGLDEFWVLLTAGMLQAKISDPEYQTLTSAFLQGAQGDPVPQHLTNLTATIRGAVRDNGKTPLGPEGTVPGSFSDDALTIVQQILYLRAPTIFKDQIETLGVAVAAAKKRIADLGKGIGRAEEPSNPTVTEKPPAPSRWGSDPKVHW